jgi:fatty-acyl-CoA synthase
VREVVVVGVTDEDFGQRLAAFVVSRVEVDEGALKDHVRSHLAGYKVPRDVVFLDELPRNASGKVMVRELPGVSP